MNEDEMGNMTPHSWRFGELGIVPLLELKENKQEEAEDRKSVV